ncbi:MAG: hypothetical protein LBG80_18775, partial [Bacteroidales bacterium]|nr:hypothetical protein [Bacteroidales bacterium]
MSNVSFLLAQEQANKPAITIIFTIVFFIVHIIFNYRGCKGTTFHRIINLVCWIKITFVPLPTH